MLKRILVLISMTSLLAACGAGGGSAGDPPFGGGGGGGGGGGATGAAAVDVLTSSPQVGSGGDQVTISAIVKGAGNVSLPKTTVVFSTDSGILTDAATTTDDAGVATAKLSAGAAKGNRSIRVSATSGSAAGFVVVEVTGTTLAFSGATTIPLAKVEQVSVKATDSKGLPISGLAVAVSSSLGNGLSSASLTTDVQGNALVSYTATRSGNDQLTFSGGGTTATAAITISGEDFVFVSPAANAQIPVNTPQQVTVRYLVGGAPQAGRTVNFAATAGTLSAPSAVTDGSGQATVTVTSSTSSPATVRATLQPGASAQADLPVEFVAVTPASLVLQVSPTAIGPNASGSAQQAGVIATVRDASGNPVKGVTVNFNRQADPSQGNLSQASAVTDSSGQASVQYISGAQTTSSNGVVLRGTVASAPSVFGQATLTVNQSALFIGLGTGNTIANVPGDDTTYLKNWTVSVTDANGQPVANVRLTMKVLPTSYLKGTLAWNGTAWVYASGVVTCTNEDDGAGTLANAFNGVLDAGEDFNGSGTLEPGNVIIVSPREVTTGTDGRALISLTYAESYVPWVRVRLRAEAVVSGTESSKEAVFTVSGAASDFSTVSNPPAGVISPFGTGPCNVPN